MKRLIPINKLDTLSLESGTFVGAFVYSGIDFEVIVADKAKKVLKQSLSSRYTSYFMMAAINVANWIVKRLM